MIGAVAHLSCFLQNNKRKVWQGSAWLILWCPGPRRSSRCSRHTPPHRHLSPNEAVLVLLSTSIAASRSVVFLIDIRCILSASYSKYRAHTSTIFPSPLRRCRVVLRPGATRLASDRPAVTFGDVPETIGFVASTAALDIDTCYLVLFDFESNDFYGRHLGSITCGRRKLPCHR
jgi:hypothetical protein